MRISIFGLGYVGAVSAGCLVRDGHTVIGCDIDPTKLQLLRDGRTPIIEAGMEELISQAAASGRLLTTDDANGAVADTELSFICVGTPSAPNGGQDLTAMKHLARQLGQAMRSNSELHTFMIRSTVLPGTVEGVVRPILEEHSGKTAGRDFDLGFQPEFLREGSSIRDYDNPPFTVAGVAEERAAERLREIFGHLPCRFVTATIRVAEMLKYCCNAFHALKITFANEVGRIAQSLDADSHEVMNLVCQDTELNISTAYLKPGFAFGGSCLPKDLRALLHAAKRNDVDAPMLGSILPSNRIHTDRAVETILRTGKKSVGMIGLSFKSGTDDLRESPLVSVAEQLIGKGYSLRIHDPAVNLARLMGANKRYIEESIPHISSLLADCDRVVRDSEVLVVAMRDEEILRSVYENGRDDQIVLDLANIPDKSRVRGEYHGICW